MLMRRCFLVLNLIVNVQLFSSLLTPHDNALKIYEYCDFNAVMDGLHYIREVTEYRALELLKKTSLVVKTNHIAAPWSLVLFFGYGGCNKLYERFGNLRLSGGFTVCCLDTYALKDIIGLLKKIGIDCVFTANATNEIRVWDGIHIEPFPYAPMVTLEPSTKKDIFYSFIGAATHHVRNTIFSMSHSKNAVIKQRREWFSTLTPREKENLGQEYRDVLARSRFSLCPRGNECSSVRFWESLQAGAIPVLISDTVRLPETFDWSSAIIRIPESAVGTVPRVLEDISPEQEESMRNACLNAAEQFSGENLVSVIRDYYSRK